MNKPECPIKYKSEPQMNVVLQNIIDQLQAIQMGGNWIGVNYKNKIESLTDSDFFIKPDHLHSVAELISHLIVWREETIMKIRSGKGLLKDDHPSNWKSNEQLKRLGKEKIMHQYAKSLMELTGLLNSKSDDFLGEKYFDTDFRKECTYAFLINGVLEHDIYHLAQIALTIKMIKKIK